jgi:hypothetical protein
MLRGFILSLDHSEFGNRPNRDAYIGQWNGSQIVGPALYESAVQQTTSSITTTIGFIGNKSNVLITGDETNVRGECICLWLLTALILSFSTTTNIVMAGAALSVRVLPATFYP